VIDPDLRDQTRRRLYWPDEPLHRESRARPIVAHPVADQPRHQGAPNRGAIASGLSRHPLPTRDRDAWATLSTPRGNLPHPTQNKPPLPMTSLADRIGGHIGLATADKWRPQDLGASMTCARHDARPVVTRR